MTRRDTIPQECKVGSVPPYVRAKITEFKKACMEHAFHGAKSAEDADEDEEVMWSCWYNLERTIATAMTTLGGTTPLNSPFWGTGQTGKTGKTGQNRNRK